MALMNVAKKIEKARVALGVTDNEVVVAACTTNPKGTMKRSVAVGLGGVIGAAVAARREQGDEDETLDYANGLAQRFVGGQNALVLTDQRLFLAKMSALTGKPKQIVAEWRRDEVAHISVEETKLSFPMTIAFIDGSGVHVEGAKGTDPRALAF